jgi:hypothetical protein
MTDLNNGSFGSSNSTGSQGDTPSPKEMLDQTKQAAKDQVQGLTSKVQDTAKEKVSKGQETASRTLFDFADAVRKAGDELASKDQSTVGRVVKQAADSLEGISRSLSEKRPEELLNSVRDFGRANPIAFVGGAVLFGLALGRFAKSSASRSEYSGESRSFSGGSSSSSSSSSSSDRTGGSDSFYETAGPASTSPVGSGTGIDPTTSPFDTVTGAGGASTSGLSGGVTNDSLNRGDLDDGLSGGVQGARL